MMNIEHIKFTLNKLMLEKEVSLNQLAKISGLSINTIRKIKNNEEHNPEVRTLDILAGTLNCKIKDLLDEDNWVYEIIANQRKEHPLFINKQYFNAENISLLKNSFLNIGICAEFIPNNISLTTLSIKSSVNKGPVALSIYIRINKTSSSVYVEVTNFNVYVNPEVVNEEKTKSLLIETIELFAKQNNIYKVIFLNIDDKDPLDYFSYPCESNLKETTYKCNTLLDVKILKSRGYILQKCPYMKSSLNDKWIKTRER